MTPAGVMRWSGQFLNVHRVPHDEVLRSLNELLLIDWPASFTYISMERFWRPGAEP